MEKTIEEKYVEELDIESMISLVKDYRSILKGNTGEQVTTLESIGFLFAVENATKTPSIMEEFTVEQAQARVVHTIMFLIYEELALRYIEVYK